VRDIVGLYLSPPTQALVLSIDEKGQVRALDRELRAARHNLTACRTRDRLGLRHRQVLKAPSATEFLNLLKKVDARIPAGLDVRTVMDNYAIQKTPKIKAWLARCSTRANWRTKMI